MKHALATAGKVLLAIIAVPVAVLATLMSELFRLKEKRTAAEVATLLRNFIEGAGDDWDWDDFTSLPIADPQLDHIRKRAASVELPLTDEGTTILRGLLTEAERPSSP